MNLQVGVKALLKNKGGKYLLLHRNPVKYPDVKNGWDIVGGRIDPGMPLFDNLKREVMEETKLTLEKEPRLIAAQDILRADKHVVRLTFVGEIDGKPQLDEEHDKFGWFCKEEMHSLDGLDDFTTEVLAKYGDQI
jgi:8-oxo-dGTP pyrophosphatase MutT (NUDIX family)